jgi:hypothetical protein
LNIKISGNNQFRFGIGEENLSNIASKKTYFENITETKLTINKFTLGLRLDYIDPAEIGNNFKGLRKRYIEFSSDKFEIRAGTFNEIFNRGLTLNCYEQRELAFDTGIDGIRIFYKNSFTENNSFKIKAGILAGSIEYSDYLKPDRIEKYSIKDLNFETKLFTIFSLGFNFVYSSGNIPSGNIITNTDSYLPELYLAVNTPKFQFLTAYAQKKTYVNANELYPVNFASYGDGLYFSGNYSLPGLGITLEYKNYRFDLTAPDNQSPDRATKVLPFQNPPTVLKQQTSVLTSRISHPVNFNDDVGFQLDVLIIPTSDLTISLNAALSSMHYSFYDSDTANTVNFKAEERSLDFIPSLKEDYSPNLELSAESEYEFSGRLSGKAGFIYQKTINYNYFIKDYSEIIKYYTVPVESRYSLSKSLSVKLQCEVQLVNKSFGEKYFQDYLNYYFSCSITNSPSLTFSFNAEFTTDEWEASGRKNWIEAEVSWKHNTSNVISIAYGSERGGLRCSGGICRYINPFNGFRLSIKSIFE